MRMYYVHMFEFLKYFNINKILPYKEDNSFNITFKNILWIDLENSKSTINDVNIFCERLYIRKDIFLDLIIGVGKLWNISSISSNSGFSL